MKSVKTATTLDKVVRQELRRIADEMKRHKDMPYQDVNKWPLPTKAKTKPFINYINKTVEQSHNKCDNWALTIDRILELMK